jgi:hypothetical protein
MGFRVRASLILAKAVVSEKNSVWRSAISQKNSYRHSAFSNQLKKLFYPPDPNQSFQAFLDSRFRGSDGF